MDAWYLWMIVLQIGKSLIYQRIKVSSRSCLFKMVDLVKTPLIVVKAVC